MSLATALLILASLAPAQGLPPRPLQSLPARELPGSQQGGEIPAPQLAPAQPAEDLVTLDPQGARLDWREGRWQLVNRDQVVKDFGNKALEARQAYTLIRDLRLTQRGTVGGDRPVMEYWLSDGQPPQGRMWDLRTVNFSGDTLEVEQVRNEWCVRDARQVVLVFGRDEKGAREALAVLKKYGFNQAGVLGQPAPTMMVFFRQQQNSGHLSTARVQPLQHTPHALRSSPLVPAQQQGKVDAATLAALPPTPLIPSLAQPKEAEQPRIQQAAYKPPQQPAAVAEPTAPLLFDAQQVQAVREGGDWRLRVGNQTLGNFGLNEPAARQAEAAIRFYHCTEYQRLNKTEPALGYFLCAGQPPRGLLGGLNGEVFQPELVAMRQRGQSWAVMQGQRVLVECGPNAADAQAMIEAIRKHRFDGVCRIGQGDGALTFFVRFR